MKKITLQNRANKYCARNLAKVWTLFAVAVFSSGAVFASAPPALTNIGNTASASFTDANGKAGLITSNPVVTTVQQVGAFALDSVTGVTTTVINTKTGIAGGTLYAPHVLTNTGNGSDQFNISVSAGAGNLSKIEIFADDGSGNPTGSALCSAATATTCSLTAPVTVAGSNGTFKFVVAYTIPATATGTGSPYETTTVTAAPVTASAAMYVLKKAEARDAINLTTGTAFTMTKSIGVPAVSAPGGGRWPTAAAGGKTSSSSSCSTTWTNTLASSSTCVYTVYTLQFTNIGLAAGRFAFSDVLPSGLTYVSGSAVWSSSPGTALTDPALGDPTGIDFRFSGTTLSAVVASIGPTVTQTLSFVVLVNNSATVGSSTTNNVAYYNPDDAGSSATSTTPGSLVTPTATTPYTVYGRFGIALGSTASNSGNSQDAVAGTPNADANDTTTVASAEPASIVKFTQKVYNLGDASDTVNLTVNAGTFPSGTTFFLFGSDGATPLQDTGVRDGTVDTGPIPAGGQATVVVAAFLPSGIAVGTVNYSAVLLGTSTNDTSKIDGTRDTITTISRGLVDLTNSISGNGVSGSTANGDVGAGPSPSPTTTNDTTPGVPTAFNLYIQNNDTAARVYTLAASSSTNFPGNLPPNWIVKFLAGANATCSASATGLADTGSVAANSQIAVTACVTPGPAQAPVVAQKFYFKVTATNANAAGVIASDTKTDAVTVSNSAAQKYAASLVGANSGQLASPGTVTYSHILTNIGLMNCGAYTIQVAFPPAEVAAGWTSTVSLANDGVPEQLVTGAITTPLLPGAANAQKILVRVTAPSGLPVGSTSVGTVTATFAAPNSCGAPSVNDLTTVTTGSVQLNKTQALNVLCDGTADATPTTSNLSVKPGACIYYHVQAVNQGVAPVSNLTINDEVPAYTKLNSVQPRVACSATNTTGTQPVFASSGANISCGSSSSILNPGGTVTLDYTVIINN